VDWVYSMFQVFRDRRPSNEEQVDELLSAYLDGMLTPKERARVEMRLRKEPALLGRLDGLRQTKNALATLPGVELPRNFILTPSMVAPARQAARPPLRLKWPVFGWATAAATLLFLLVFAGDVFFLAPSRRSQPAEVVVRETESMSEKPADVEAPAPAAVEEVEPTVIAEPEEVVLEAETSEEAAELEEVPVEEMSTTAPSAEVSVTAAAEVEEAPAAAAELKVTSDEDARGSGATPALSDVLTNTVEIEAATLVTGELPVGALSQATPVFVPEPLTEEGEQQAPLVVPAPVLGEEDAQDQGVPLGAPPPEVSESTEGGSDSQILQEQGTGTEVEIDAGPTAEGAPIWLRLVEVLLGLAAAGFGVATWMLRRLRL
jgi:hypothetical protein